MNFIDLVLLIIVAVAIIAGWAKGFIKGIVDLLVWIGSLVTGFICFRYMGDILKSLFPALNVWTLPFAFIFIVILTRLLLSLIFYKVLETTPAQTHRAPINRIFGIFPGFVNGFIYATIIAAILLSIPLNDTISATTKDSLIAGQLTEQVAWLDNKLSPIFSDAAKKLHPINAESKSDETVELNYTVKNAPPRPDLEARMLELVNIERTKRGLNPLKADPELTRVARAHSKDMFARGYFSHYTPERKDPFDRMKDAQVRFFSAGENLALGQTLDVCHTGLMNSPGHKANILHKSFGRVGIGILDGGFHGLMISQEFRN